MGFLCLAVDISTSRRWLYPLPRFKVGLFYGNRPCEIAPGVSFPRDPSVLFDGFPVDSLHHTLPRLHGRFATLGNAQLAVKTRRVHHYD